MAAKKASQGQVHHIFSLMGDVNELIRLWLLTYFSVH